MLERFIQKILNDNNGNFIVNDKSIAPYASDIECRILSNWKVGKEGSTSDCVAYLLTSFLIWDTTSN